MNSNHQNNDDCHVIKRKARTCSLVQPITMLRKCHTAPADPVAAFRRVIDLYVGASDGLQHWVNLVTATVNFTVRAPPRVHTYDSLDFFLVQKTDPRKARLYELAKIDENRRAVGMLNPLRDKQEGMHRGGEVMTHVITAYPEAGKEKLRFEKKTPTGGMHQ